MKQRKHDPHRIATVRFDKGSNDGVLACTCEAEMRVSEYAAHRRENGLKAPQAQARHRATDENRVHWTKPRP